MSGASRKSMGRRTVEQEGVGGGLQAGRHGAMDPGTGGRVAREVEKTAGNERKETKLKKVNKPKPGSNFVS